MLLKRIRYLESGLAKSSFALPYRGTMIWCEHLDALGDHTQEAVQKLQGDQPAFAKPSATSLMVVVADETLVNQTLCEQLAIALTTGGTHIRKLALVGLSFGEHRRFRHAMQACAASYPISYFTDLEKAKEWLVSR